MKKVAIQEEPSDQEKYDFTTTPVRYEGGGAQTVATDDKVSTQLRHDLLAAADIPPDHRPFRGYLVQHVFCQEV